MNAIERIRGVIFGGLWGLMAFTFVVNLLLLVQPVYMLQVYDRVLSSGSVDTLIYVSIMAAGALALMGILDAVRNVIAGRMGARIEVVAANDAMISAMNGSRASIGDVQPLRDLQTIRAFIAGRALFAYLDLPFSPIFIAILWFIHPVLFTLTLVGAIVLTVLAFLNQWATTRAGQESSEQGMNAMLAAQSFVRNAESIRAMGMVENVIDTWGQAESRSLTAQDRMNRINSWFSGISKSLRMGLQIAILGVGGYLVLEREITGGMIFASSLIAGRGLQPIDQVIAGWKGLIETRKSWDRLKRSLDTVALPGRATELPEPVGTLSFHQLVVMPPHNPAGDPLIKKVSAYVKAGTCVALIGPSGAGKSTLVRTVVGAVPIRAGAVRVDGADIRNWNPEQLGRRLGYLSQDVELLPGTVAQNIARFDPDATDDEIVAAAQKAQVHELIQRLPKGYQTPLGPAGLQLSGGQRQRVGLARAFFGSPRILVLDEPNAHLDADGDAALERAVLLAKAEKVTVLIVTHRRNIAEYADSIMILRDGAIEDFGTRAEVYGRQNARKRAEDERQAAAQAARKIERPAARAEPAVETGPQEAVG